MATKETYKDIGRGRYFKSITQCLNELDIIKESYQKQQESLKDQRDEFLRKGEDMEGRLDIWSDWGLYSGLVHSGYVGNIKEIINKNLKLKWRLILPLSKRKLYGIVNLLRDHIDSTAEYDLIKMIKAF